MRCSPRISSHGHMRQPSPRGVLQTSLAVSPTTPRTQIHTTIATPIASPRLGSATPRAPLYAGLSTPPAPAAQWSQQKQAIHRRAPLGATPVSETRSKSPAVASRQTGLPGSPGPARRQTHFGTMPMFSIDSRCPVTSPRRASPPSSPRPLTHRGTSVSGRATPRCQGPSRTATQPGTPPPPSPRGMTRSGGSTPGRPQAFARPAQEVRRRRPSVVATPVSSHAVTAAQQPYVTNVAASCKRVASHPRLETLAPGVVVNVSDHELRITAALGEGSFGTVWGAKYENAACGGYGEVALKEIPCYSQQALADAVFEGEILRALATMANENRNMPSLIDMEILPQGEESWYVRIAMSRVPGEPLSRFIEEHRPDLCNSRREKHHALANAAVLACELVLQLAPTFERVATKAYHRDVTPRNILIDQSGEFPRFGLIDFGLSVDSLLWRTGMSSVPSLLPSDGTPAWQHLGVAGDGRYWPVASWYMFEMGFDKLSRHAGLELEYKMHLDFHSLGISALQVLLMMAPMEHEQIRLEDKEDKDDELLSRLWQLQRAWEQYWEDATKFWQCIYDTFRSGGDFKSLKAAYVRAGVHESVRKDLTAVRISLALVRESAARLSFSGLTIFSGLIVLMDALLSMIGIGDRNSPNTWGNIREILEGVHEESQSSRKAERTSTSSATVPGKMSEVVSPPSTAAPTSPISSASVDSLELSAAPTRSIATTAPPNNNNNIYQKTPDVTTRL